MICKSCNGLVSRLENSNCHEGLGTKLVLRYNNSKGTSETSFHSTRKSYDQISTLGLKAIGKWRNAALKLFAILNLGKLASQVTWAKNTKKLVETSGEVIDSNMKTTVKEPHSVSNNNGDIKSAGVSFDWTWNS